MKQFLQDILFFLLWGSGIVIVALIFSWWVNKWKNKDPFASDDDK